MKTHAFLLATTLAASALSVPCLADKALSRTIAKPSASVASRSWVALKASTDESRYTVGQPISVRLSATNTHRSGAYLRFTSGQRFDFTVYKAGTNESVYTWSASRMFMQSTGFLWLKPGQSENFEANIGDEMGALKPGKYKLVARLTNSPNSIIATPITFEVVDLGIELTTTIGKTTYKVGEPVKINIKVKNRLSKANSVPFRSSMIFDAIIFDETEKQIWNYGANVRFAGGLRRIQWKAGETKSYPTTWNGVSLANADPSTSLPPGRWS